ncbi:MAG: hypothetical protein AB1896_03240 [Thermodesulfobacteriota bacterium]
MSRRPRPMAATMVYGFFCGLVFIPCYLGQAWLGGGRLAFNLTAWAFLAGYGLVLAYLGRTRPAALVLPLALLAAAAVFAETRSGFGWPALAVLAWMRSGTENGGPPFRKTAAEALALAGGAGLLAYYQPLTPLAWALSAWMFFLVQSLYFVVMGEVAEWSGEPDSLDRFEKARRRAEAILSG